MTNYNQSSSVPMTYCANCGKWFATGTAHTCVVPALSGNTIVYMSLPFQPSPLEQKVLEILDRLEKIEQKIERVDKYIAKLDRQDRARRFIQDAKKSMEDGDW